jgi:positive regulator of sigma E activity
MTTWSATHRKETLSLSEKILAVFTVGAIIIAMAFPMVSHYSRKVANRLVSFHHDRLHEVINRQALDPLSMIKTDRP